jgi:hypothetical protein
METLNPAARPPKRPYWFKFFWKESGVSYRCERCQAVTEIPWPAEGRTVPEWIAAADEEGQKHVTCKP